MGIKTAIGEQRLRIKRTLWVRLVTLIRLFTPSILQRYVLAQFFIALFICLFASISLFLITDFFEKTRIFVREESSLDQALLYMLYKVPLIVQLMTPVAVLVAVLISVGRLSQLSEITGMRACGVSLFFIARPLLAAGLVISVLLFIAGETVVPWSTQRVEEIYHLDIRKKVEKGRFSRVNFWYRSKNTFFNIGLYDSRNATLNGLSVLEFNEDFTLRRRIDALDATWSENQHIGWTMNKAIEITMEGNGRVNTSSFDKLPLVITETPADFYKMKKRAETLNYLDLGEYIAKLRSEGVPVTEYMVERAAKISFPLVTVITVLIAFPFALIPARSGTMTASFVAGIAIGFGYYIVHAISTSLGTAELLPVLPAAWTANVLLGCVGGYMMAGIERQ